MNYHVIREDGVKVEGLTKEQIYELINGTTGEIPEGIDEAFITKLKEINKGENTSVWIGTNAEYNAIEEKDENVLYVVTDDSIEQFIDDVNVEIATLNDNITSHKVEVGNELAIMNDEINKINEILSIKSKSYNFTSNSANQYDSNSAKTFTLTDDIEIGERVIIYITVLYKNHFSYEGDSRGYFRCNSGVVTINAKTSGEYKVISNEIVGNNSGLSITSCVGNQAVNLTKINSFDTNQYWVSASWGSTADLKGTDINVLCKCITVKIEVERLS